MLLLQVRQQTAPIQLRSNCNKTELLYVSSYLAGTARWRETGVGPEGCIVSALNCIQEFVHKDKLSIRNFQTQQKFHFLHYLRL